MDTVVYIVVLSGTVVRNASLRSIRTCQRIVAERAEPWLIRFVFVAVVFALPKLMTKERIVHTRYRRGRLATPCVRIVRNRSSDGCLPSAVACLSTHEGHFALFARVSLVFCCMHHFFKTVPLNISTWGPNQRLAFNIR